MQNKNFLKTILLASIATCVVIGIYFVFFQPKNESNLSDNDVIIKPEDFIKDAPVNADGITKTYTNSDYKFSFDYPKEFKIIESGKEIKTILINDENNKFQFQIIISYFDESGPLTKQRILQDLPDLKIEVLQEKELQSGNSVLIFLTDGSSLGKIREVWFIYNEYLYQISALQSFDNKLNQILATWKFE